MLPRCRRAARQDDAQGNGGDHQREESKRQQTLAPNYPPSLGSLALTSASMRGCLTCISGLALGCRGHGVSR
jgi:hypothetical protein